MFQHFDPMRITPQATHHSGNGADDDQSRDDRQGDAKQRCTHGHMHQQRSQIGDAQPDEGKEHTVIILAAKQQRFFVLTNVLCHFFYRIGDSIFLRARKHRPVQQAHGNPCQNSRPHDDGQLRQRRRLHDLIQPCLPFFYGQIEQLPCRV